MDEIQTNTVAESTVDNAPAETSAAPVSETPVAEERPVITDDMLITNNDDKPKEEEKKEEAPKEEPKNETKEDAAPKPDRKAQAKQNNLNAQRRIREREEKKKRKFERIEYLRKELARLEDDNKAAKAIEDTEGSIRSQLRMESVNDRLDEAYSEMEQERYDNFRSDVYEQFGGNEAAANDAVELIGKYTPYVNKNEPLVLKMTQRENGYLTLTAWCKAMNTQNFRDKWLNLLPSEKEKVLLAISGTIHKTLTAPKAAAPKAQPQAATKDVPVAKSGHDSMTASLDDNDFGSALQQIRNQRMSKFV